jgi:hypothetical protein
MGGLPADSVRAMVRSLDRVFVKVHSTGTPFDATRQVIRFDGVRSIEYTWDWNE